MMFNRPPCVSGRELDAGCSQAGIADREHPEFDRHPYVINGCSELFSAIWGEERGVGVRSAVGMGSLPGNIPVEIEALFRLEDA